MVGFKFSVIVGDFTQDDPMQKKVEIIGYD